MNWELISGVSGIVGALCALVSLRKPTAHKLLKNERKPFSFPFKLKVFASLMISWVLFFVYWLLYHEPFGAFITKSEMKRIIGVFFLFPAIVTLAYSLIKLQKTK
ncbi:hypothetical protein J8M20_08055 [Pseudoalteromonas luteoviolacea]|uniref:hypothetical protein n=1 Tax=Pseudoalteromonas luteoviolacea TaxID=43657 RepID=UPI001B385E5E|nr:hypothetical protein [Pseudoalteromonas luteoviolacea]MBQ4811286.1 hypothetical protein [Pseudoalteromonas luteoviolacea]